MDGLIDSAAAAAAATIAAAYLRSLPQANRLYARLSVRQSHLLSVCLGCALCLTHLKFIC